MNGSDRPAPAEPPSCSNCGSSLQGTLSSGSLCLRCAGVRIFELEAADSAGPTSAGGTGMPRIGPYEIIEELGRGGMGQVYAVRQFGLGRIVALKMIPLGPATPPELEMRFLREAQTSARLRHPNIVAVHDFGQVEGCVYFTMDYIEGGDLANRLRTNAFGFRAAAALIQKVAEALAYAHGQGVLHRDLKPSNILMDGEEPKLADFGLAKELAPGSGLTHLTSVLGTPHYLAPEAMSGGSAALTVASDLYAIGVVLFLLLTGRTPFAGASLAELPSILALIEPPPPRLLAPGLPRDLETICLKCLERDPGRRYGSAAALREDLRRFLANEPILARPPNVFSRFRKFTRRHRLPLAAAATVAAVLIAATAESLRLTLRAQQAEKRAATEAATSKEVTDFLQNDLLAQASPEQQPNRDLPLRVVLDRAAEKVESRFKDQPLVASSLHATLASTYESLGEFAVAGHHFERGAALRQQAIGHADVIALSMMDAYANCLAEIGQTREAEALELQTISALRGVAASESVPMIGAMTNLVAIYKLEGKLADAEAVGEKALAISRKTLGARGEQTRNAMINLSSIYFAEEKYPAAEKLNAEAVDLERSVLGPDHPDTLTAISNLASVYWAEQKLPEAEKQNLQILESRRRVLGPEHPNTLRSVHNLATTYTEEGRLTEAVALESHNLELRRRIVGPEHADTLSSANTLAKMYVLQGRFAEADELESKSLGIARRVLGPSHYLALAMANSLAGIYQKEGKLADSEALYRKTAAEFERAYGRDDPRTLQVRDNLGAALLGEEKFAEAEALLRATLEAHLKVNPADWSTDSARSELGAALTGLGRYAEAAPLLWAASTGLEKSAAQIPAYGRENIALVHQRLARLERESAKSTGAASGKEP